MELVTQASDLDTKATDLLRSLDQKSPGTGAGQKSRFPLLLVAVVLLGIGTGWGIARWFGPGRFGGGGGLKSSEEVKQSGIHVGDVIGMSDEKTFRDSAEGVLADGGINGEGSHHLLREGGPSQNVYLTSSVVNLDPIVGSKIKVWGETFAAQKAGWLMDVGRVQVLELNARPPFEE